MCNMDWQSEKGLLARSLAVKGNLRTERQVMIDTMSYDYRILWCFDALVLWCCAGNPIVLLDFSLGLPVSFQASPNSD